MNLATSYVEYRCLDCGHIIWSKDNEEIETLRKLHGQGALVCPVCQSKMNLVGRKAILHGII